MIRRIWDITFAVTDLKRAVDFYENVLGLQKKYEYASYAGFDCGGVEIGLQPGEKTEEIIDAPCVDFLVDDVDETYRLLKGKGVKFSKEPHDTPWGGRIALFRDPDGNPLQLVQIHWRKYFAACAPK